MASSVFKLQVLVRYADGPEVPITVGQRELAAFEAQPISRYGSGTLLRLRYAAYDALRRAGKLPPDRKGQPVDWEAWDDLVDEVDYVDDEDEDEAGPTPPDRPAGT